MCLCNIRPLVRSGGEGSCVPGPGSLEAAAPDALVKDQSSNKVQKHDDVATSRPWYLPIRMSQARGTEGFERPNIRDDGCPQQQSHPTKQIWELKGGLSCSCQQLVSTGNRETGFCLQARWLDRAFSVSCCSCRSPTLVWSMDTRTHSQAFSTSFSWAVELDDQLTLLPTHCAVSVSYALSCVAIR